MINRFLTFGFNNPFSNFFLAPDSGDGGGGAGGEGDGGGEAGEGDILDALDGLYSGGGEGDGEGDKGGEGEGDGDGEGDGEGEGEGEGEGDKGDGEGDKNKKGGDDDEDPDDILKSILGDGDPDKKAGDKKGGDVTLPDPAAIKEPDKLSKGAKQGWDALKNHYSEARTKVEAMVTRVQELEQALASKPKASNEDVEKLTTRVRELEQYEAVINLETSDDFKTKYAEPIANLERQAKTALQPFYNQDISGAELSPQVLIQIANQLDGVDAKANPSAPVIAAQVRAIAAQLAPKVLERDTVLKDAKTQYQKLLDGKKTSGTQAQAERITAFKSTVAELVESQPDLGFLKPVPTAGLTGEKLTAAQQHNQRAQQMSAAIEGVLDKAQDPKALARLALLAVSAPRLEAELARVREGAQKLHARLKKISAAGSGKGKTNTPSGKGRDKGSEFDNIEDAFDAYFKG